MGRIKVLPENVVNQIAAGEVVERPASAVKELVENSIDAGAQQIQVDIQKGGKSLIRVTDDGCGMSREDAVLALERHATSKLETADGLHAIQTMGFRGEAMPAIASVSRLQLLTRPATEELGTRLSVRGGTLMEVESAGCNPGTRIEVRDLYFNTPARRKFLKSEGAETAAVTEVISNTLLAHPERQFKLVLQGKTALMSPGSGRLKDAADTVFDRDLVKAAREIDPVEWPESGTRFHGLISAPGHCLPSRRAIRLFVNRRPVRSASLSKALLAAFRNALPVGKYPLALLFFEIEPWRVDVNVHPGKLEVRLHDERVVEERLMAELRRHLGGLRPARSFDAPPPGEFSTAADPGVQGDFKEVFAKGARKPEADAFPGRPQPSADDERDASPGRPQPSADEELSASPGRPRRTADDEPEEEDGAGEEALPRRGRGSRHDGPDEEEPSPRGDRGTRDGAPRSAAAGARGTGTRSRGVSLSPTDDADEESTTDVRPRPRWTGTTSRFSSPRTPGSPADRARHVASRGPVAGSQEGPEGVGDPPSIQGLPPGPAPFPGPGRPAPGATSPGTAPATLSTAAAAGEPLPGMEALDVPPDWSLMSVLGQAFHTYILGTDGENLFFVDQHVAHERILFEQALGRLGREPPHVQTLLFPLRLDLPAGSVDLILDRSDLLKQHGVEVGRGEGGVLEVRTVPIVSERLDTRRLVEALLEEVESMGTIQEIDRVHRRVAATIACRSAVMAGDPLEVAEMTRLVRDLSRVDQPMTCPHGRPSVLVIQKKALDRRFLRC